MTTRTLKKADKVVKRVRLFVRVFLTMFIILFLIFAAVSMIVTIMLMKSWLLGHRVELQSPIQFRSPIVVSEVKRIALSDVLKDSPKAGSEATRKSEKLEKSEEDIVMEQKDGRLLWAMYQLETQRGKTDYCRNSGKGYGGWGVKSSGSIVCYESFSKAVERAQYWLTKNRHDSTLAQALCRWSGHGEVNDCVYYRNALSLM